MPSQRDLAGAALMGAVSGVRTFTGPAALALRGRVLSGSPGRYALLAAAAGEYAGDKSPWVPPRVSPPALAGRVASGAFGGHAVGGPFGAGVGAAAAAAGTFGSYHARQGLTDLTGLPSPVLGLVGDGIAIAGAALATRPDIAEDEPEDVPRVRRIGRGVVRGAAAGVFGTAVLTGAQLAVQRATGGGESRAPEQVGRKLAKRVLGKRVPRKQRDTLNQAMHWTYGASWGVDLGVTAALAGGRPPVLAGGVGLGLAAWVAGLSHLPILGVAPPPWEQPPASLGIDAGFHLLYGLAVAAALSALP